MNILIPLTLCSRNEVTHLSGLGTELFNNQ